MEKTAPPLQEKEKKSTREDLKMLWIAIAFSIGFTFLLSWLGLSLQDPSRFGPFLEDKGATWYFWKLPDTTFWSYFTPWAFYIAHQVIIWMLTWKGMSKLQTHKPAWTTKPAKIHYWILGANVAFCIFHLIQTQLWYDGLAQSVPIWTSQFSVIGMLIMILVMENARRGIFWGKKVKISKDAYNGIYKWHGDRKSVV